MRDEDLYKFLQDLKRPCSVLKKLKCIPGTLKLDISPLTDDIKNCLTPELAPLLPVSGMDYTFFFLFLFLSGFNFSFNNLFILLNNNFFYLTLLRSSKKSLISKKY